MKKKCMSLFLMAMLTLTMVFAVGCGGNANSKEDITGQADQTAEATTKAEQKEPTDGATSYPLTITDALGTEITIEEEPQKVVSLSPANTETLFAIGAGDRVVGRTEYCSYPEEAASVATIGSYAEPNVELIVSLSPDVIFASDFIDETVKNQLEQVGAKVIVFSANDVESVKNVITMAGQVLNLNDNAKAVTDKMTADLEELQKTIAENKEEVSAFIDLGSYYSAGKDSLLGNMLNDISVKNVVEDTGEQWPQVSVEKIVEYNPDVYISLFTAPDELKKVSGLNNLDCMKEDKIVFYEATSPEGDLVQRAGPRIVEGEKNLAKNIYPDLFQ